jgi:Domain of unknown function (DUF6538)
MYYYFRVRVPGKLYKYFGCKELKKSLYTSDLKTAKQSVKPYISEYERVVTIVRSNILAKEEKEQLVRQFFKEALDRAENRKLHPSKPVSKDDVEGVFRDMICSVKEWLNNGSEEIEPILDNFLSGKGIGIDKTSFDYKKLRRDINKAIIKYLEVEIERYNGNYDNWYDDFRSTLKPREVYQQLPIRKGKHLSELIDDYIREKTTKNDWNGKNTAESIQLYKQFLEIMGDKDILELKREDFVEYMKILQNIS